MLNCSTFLYSVKKKFRLPRIFNPDRGMFCCFRRWGNNDACWSLKLHHTHNTAFKHDQNGTPTNTVFGLNGYFHGEGIDWIQTLLTNKLQINMAQFLSIYCCGIGIVDYQDKYIIPCMLSAHHWIPILSSWSYGALMALLSRACWLSMRRCGRHSVRQSIWPTSWLHLLFKALSKISKNGTLSKTWYVTTC